MADTSTFETTSWAGLFQRTGRLSRSIAITDSSGSLDSGSAGAVSDSGVNQFTFDLPLEYSEGGGVASDSRAFLVPASNRPTKVTITPAMTGKAGPHSDEYLATLRRRKITAIAAKLKELTAREADDRFMFTVDALNTKIKEALEEFAEAKREGNSREILRTLLNTLRNGGWDRYKQSAVAGEIQKFLARVGNVEWIESEQVDKFHSLVEELELDSLTLPAAQWPE